MVNNFCYFIFSIIVVINCYSEGYVRFFFVFVVDILFKLMFVMICNNFCDIFEFVVLLNSIKNL